MADLGADVVKVETEGGDHARTRPPLREGSSTYFGQMNHGKRSLVLDLKSESGYEVAKSLARQADVVVENWRPGVAAGLKLSYDDLREESPNIIYCSISGYGQVGPGAHRPAYAPLVHAASGFDLANMAIQGGSTPATTGVFIADVVAGLAAFAAIQTALLRRQVCGAGDYIDVSMMDAMLNLMVFEVQDAQIHGGNRAVYPALRTLDGHVVIVPATQDHFRRLSVAAEHPEWAEDARFSTLKARDKNWSSMMELIEGWTSGRLGEEVEARLLAAGVPCAVHRTVEQAMRDSQTVARGAFQTVEDDFGEFQTARPPYQFRSHVLPAVRSRVPTLGEHTAEVLKNGFK